MIGSVSRQPIARVADSSNETKPQLSTDFMSAIA
jgi:hypothetical protein